MVCSPRHKWRGEGHWLLWQSITETRTELLCYTKKVVGGSTVYQLNVQVFKWLPFPFGNRPHYLQVASQAEVSQRSGARWIEGLQVYDFEFVDSWQVCWPLACFWTPLSFSS